MRFEQAEPLLVPETRESVVLNLELGMEGPGQGLAQGSLHEVA